MEILKKLQEAKAELQEKINRASMPESAKIIYRKKLKDVDAEIEELNKEQNPSPETGMEALDLMDSEQEKMDLTPEKKSEKKEVSKPASKPEKKAESKKKADKKVVGKQVKTESKDDKSENKDEIVIDGKTISKKDADWCEKLLAAWKEKRKKAKDSTKRSGKRTPMQQVVSNVGHAVAVAIDNTPAADIQQRPTTVINKFERLKKSAENFLKSFKDVLGDDFSNAQIQKEFAEVEKLINQIKKKYANG